MSNYHNINYTSFKAMSPEYICSQLCKGACCNHATTMPATLKRATDKLMGEFFKNGRNAVNHIAIKRPVYSWGISALNTEAKNLNEQINILIKQLHKESSIDKIEAISLEIDKLNARLEAILDNQEVFLPITNPIFQDNPETAVTSKLPNICMYKDPKTNKCTIYYGLQTPEGKTIERPSPCHQVGSDNFPCAWLNPEKLGEVVEQTRTLLATHGYTRIPNETLLRYVSEQQNLNDVWAEEIYLPYLKSIEKQ